MLETRSDREWVREVVARYQRGLEVVGASGDDLLTMTRSVLTRLPADIARHLAVVANTHDRVCLRQVASSIEKREAFEVAVEALDAFFERPYLLSAVRFESWPAGWKERAEAALVALAATGGAAFGAARLAGAAVPWLQRQGAALGAWAVTAITLAVALLAAALAVALLQSLVVAIEERMQERASLHYLAAVATPVLLLPWIAAPQAGRLYLALGWPVVVALLVVLAARRLLVNAG